MEWRLINAAARRWPGLLRETGVPGAVLALGLDDRPVRTFASGMADRGSSEMMTPRTRFRVASLAKPIAAIVILRLVQEGVLELDEPIPPRIGPWRPVLSVESCKALTIRRLLSHTAGLAITHAPHVAITDGLSGSIECVLNGSFGEEFVPRPTDPFDPTRGYTGGGFVLLQAVIEERTGRPFATLAEELLIRPLGLSDTSFELCVRTGPGVATHHDATGMAVPAMWSPGIAASGLTCSMEDLVRIMRAVMRAASDEDSDPILSPALAREYLTPLTGESDSFALGLAVQRAGNGHILGHGGVREGMRAVLNIVPRARCVVAAAANGERANQVIQPLIGLAQNLALARGYRKLTGTSRMTLSGSLSTT